MVAAIQKMMLALVPLGFANAKVTPNEEGVPQEITKAVCGNRSSICSVLLDVPEQCGGAQSKCPISFFFHGHKGMVEQEVVGIGPKLIREYGFIGVYPQGEKYGDGTGWNDGSMLGNKCAFDDFDCHQDPNDPLFVSEIITYLRSIGASGRIYLTGGSNGANEVQILAANAGLALPIAGIAANSGQLLASPLRSGPNPFNYNQPAASGTSARPGDGRPIAQLAQHGSADPLIPYDGGQKKVSPSGFNVMSEPDSDKTWKTHNGCIGSLSFSEVPASYTDHRAGKEVNSTAVHWVWGGCPTIAPVEYYQAMGAGHGGDSMIDGRSWTELALLFFKKVEGAHNDVLVV